jgi:endonuclease/exonuclease/phosphatase family metal-dependent hydrolase
LRLITWNILSGAPLRKDANLFDAIATYDADVIALQEVDYLQERSMNLKTIEEIAQENGYPYWVYAPTMFGTPGTNYQTATDHKSHSHGADIPTSYGIALLSRIPIKSYEILTLKKAPFGLPLIVQTPKGPRAMFVPDEPRMAIAATLENAMTVVTAHLSFVPPFNTMQLRRIKRWSEKFEGKKVFLGDFNWLLFGKAGLKSLNKKKSYPGWKPKVKFDFILSNDVSGQVLELDYLGVSDHRPIGIKTAPDFSDAVLNPLTTDI